MTNGTQNRPPVSFEPSEPFSLKDLPKFGQLTETARDAFLKELTDFFDYTGEDGLQKIEDLPNIQKFAFGSAEGNTGLETVVNMIMAFADTPDKFPMISITSSSLRQRVMDLGVSSSVKVQFPSSIKFRNKGPFNLTQIIGDPVIIINTNPLGLYFQESRISFDTSLFKDPANVTIHDIERVINATQALYYQLVIDGEYLRIEAGGKASPTSKNSIEVNGGNTQLLNLLGLEVGDVDSYNNPSNPEMYRDGIAADMVINIDVIADSINARLELSDLVYSFFAYYMKKKAFQLFGRSYFDRSIDTEWWHLVLNNQFSWSGEINKPRQGGEQYEHVYAVRGSVPIFIEDFKDKVIVEDPTIIGTDNVTITQMDAAIDIIGDYTGINYKKL
jgi:hypothetical protein